MVIVVRFAEPLATFVLYAKVIDLMEAALGKITALLAIEPLPVQTPAQAPQRFDIRFEDVTFRYADTAQDALHQMDARLPERTLTALVGPSGSGKTTLTRLLMRHADPQAGRITIGGVDVRAIAPDRLNTLVSVVFQDVYLFDDTILANIRMARPDAGDEEVQAAMPICGKRSKAQKTGTPDTPAPPGPPTPLEIEPCPSSDHAPCASH